MVSELHGTNSSAQKQPANANAQAGNAIYVNRKLLGILRSALKKGASAFDTLPSDRELLDSVLAQMAPSMLKYPVYSTISVDESSRYVYFGSQWADDLKRSELLDKGRFVDACIIAYLSGSVGLRKWCVHSKVVRLPKLDEDKRHRIEQAAAEIAASKSVDSGFEPCSLTPGNFGS